MTWPMLGIICLCVCLIWELDERQTVKKHKNKMIHNISKICEISKDQINIKVKTTEKLGVIGKEKAIATEVIVSIVKYD